MRIGAYYFPLVLMLSVLAFTFFHWVGVIGVVSLFLIHLGWNGIQIEEKWIKHLHANLAIPEELQSVIGRVEELEKQPGVLGPPRPKVRFATFQDSSWRILYVRSIGRPGTVFFSEGLLVQCSSSELIENIQLVLKELPKWNRVERSLAAFTIEKGLERTRYQDRIDFFYPSKSSSWGPPRRSFSILQAFVGAVVSPWVSWAFYLFPSEPRVERLLGRSRSVALDLLELSDKSI